MIRLQDIACGQWGRCLTVAVVTLVVFTLVSLVSPAHSTITGVSETTTVKPLSTISKVFEVSEATAQKKAHCKKKTHREKCSGSKNRPQAPPLPPAPAAPPTAPPTDPKKPVCTESLQAKINAAPSGGTVEASGSCVYREQLTISKPITLKGQPGSEIRGSDNWTGSASWAKSGATWQSTKVVPAFSSSSSNRCEPDTSRCLWPEQVFLDGKPLEQVASGQSPTTGQFSVDSGRHVILADDPSAHTIEVTVRQHWVVGKSGSVTVEGFTMKHAASNVLYEKHAITNSGYSNWTVRNNVLSDAHATVVGLSTGTNLQIVGNDISRGGQRGIGGGKLGSELSIRNNKIHHNNTEDFANGHEAGGVKLGRVNSLVFDSNEVYENKGKGVWCDVVCQNTVFSNNRISHNDEAGIHFEISDGAKIYGNTIWENGWHYPAFGWGGGIVSSSSKNVEIYDNTLAWNADGISVISTDRDGTAYDAVTNTLVHHNTILGYQKQGVWHQFALLWGQDWAGGVLFDPLSNNRGYDNRYWYSAAEPGEGSRFQWGTKPMGLLGQFNATPGEERGRYLSNTEKGAVVMREGIPNDPEKR